MNTENPRLVVKNYLEARSAFLNAAQTIPDLKGNDNVIGRIGEFIALEYLRNKGQKPVKHPNPTNTGFDITVGKRRISVKAITAENTTGRTVRLSDPWDEFMLISLDSQYVIDVIGILRRDEFNTALTENIKWSRNPYVKRTMLSGSGLIGRYGTLDRSYRL